MPDEKRPARPKTDLPGTIIAEGVSHGTDMYKTHLNNNVIVFGTPGGGKTYGIVKPNLLQMNSSYVVLDPKGNLVKEFRGVLEAAGYEVQCLNFTNARESVHWNPFDLVRTEEDLQSVLGTLVYAEGATLKDPFWDLSSQMLLKTVAQFSQAINPRLTLRDILRWLDVMNEPATLCDGQLSRRYMDRFDEIIECWAKGQTGSDALPEDCCRADARLRQKLVAQWRQIKMVSRVPETFACIKITLLAKVARMRTDELLNVLDGGPDSIDIASIGKRKTAVFVVVSDMDHDLDALVSVFYTQLFKELCRVADEECDNNDNRLPVPVRVIMDDFANQAPVPNFDSVIAAARSRDIWLMPICQATSQLEQRYGAAAATIIGCCDTAVYIGVNDMGTARELSLRSNIPVDKIQSLPLGQALVFTRGTGCQRARSYDLKGHPNYGALLDWKEASAGAGDKRRRSGVRERGQAVPAS